jgi:hypothetical protein
MGDSNKIGDVVSKLCATIQEKNKEIQLLKQLLTEVAQDAHESQKIFIMHRLSQGLYVPQDTKPVGE